MAKLTGTNPDQVPTNADLGTMAYQDKDNLQVGNVYADGVLRSDQGAGHIIVKHDGSNGSINNNTGQLLIYAEGSGNIINHTNGVERMRITSTGEVDISSGLLELDGNDIGGTQVTIADDAVASITPPRKGGFMFVTTSGNSDFPNVECSGAMLYYDVGASLRLDKGNVFSSPVSIYVDVTTSDVTGTTGTDGYITIAAQTDVLKIENRNGGSRTLQVTFL